MTVGRVSSNYFHLLHDVQGTLKAILAVFHTSHVRLMQAKRGEWEDDFAEKAIGWTHKVPLGASSRHAKPPLERRRKDDAVFVLRRPLRRPPFDTRTSQPQSIAHRTTVITIDRNPSGPVSQSPVISVRSDQIGPERGLAIQVTGPAGHAAAACTAGAAGVVPGKELHRSPRLPCQ
jgi:hypothetical protein